MSLGMETEPVEFKRSTSEPREGMESIIFWNAVDILCPGELSSPFSPGDYFSGVASASKPRNQLIAQTLYRSDDIETYGTGLQRIKEEYDGTGVPVEVYESVDGVHIRFTRSEALRACAVAEGEKSTRKVREKYAEGEESTRKRRAKYAEALSLREKAVLTYNEESSGASASDVASKLGLSKSGSLKLLNRLRSSGLIVREGEGRKTAYRMASHEAEGEQHE